MSSTRRTVRCQEVSCGGVGWRYASSARLQGRCVQPFAGRQAEAADGREGSPWALIVAAVAVGGTFRWWVRPSGIAFGELVEAAFHTHRFALYEAMRLPLPTTAKEERERGEVVPRFIAAGSDDASLRLTPGRATSLAVRLFPGANLPSLVGGDEYFLEPTALAAAPARWCRMLPSGTIGPRTHRRSEEEPWPLSCSRTRCPARSPGRKRFRRRWPPPLRKGSHPRTAA